MTAMRTQKKLPIYGFCICIDSAFMGQSTSYTAFDILIQYNVLYFYNVDTLNVIMHKGVWLKTFLTKL